MASINLQGDTSGAITISAPSVAGSNTLTLPATTQTLATQNALGVRNLIINGDMRIAQRGTSVTNVVGGNYNTVDRWQWVEVSTATLDMEQSTDVPSGQGFVYSSKLTVNTADTSIAASDYSYYRQPIEGNNTSHLEFGTANAKTITISFWVKSSITGTYCVTLHNNTFARAYIAEYTIDSANTWEKKTITVVGDTTGTWTTDNTRGLILHFTLATGTDSQGITGWQGGVKLGTANQVNWLGTTGATLYLTGVQLEVGDTATPFEHRPYDMELARCQRYFQKSFPYSTAVAQNTGIGGNHRITIIGTGYGTVSPVLFKTTMRSTPSITTYNPYNTNNLARNTAISADISGIQIQENSDHGFFIGIFGTNHDANNGQGTSVHWSASAEL